MSLIACLGLIRELSSLEVLQDWGDWSDHVSGLTRTFLVSISILLCHYTMQFDKIGFNTMNYGKSSEFSMFENDEKYQSLN